MAVGTDDRTAALAELEDLLLALFQEGPQLTRFFRRLYGPSFVQQLPAAAVPFEQLAHEATALLERNGHVGAALLEKIAHERPAQVGRVTAAARAMGLRPPDPSPLGEGIGPVHGAVGPAPASGQEDPQFLVHTLSFGHPGWSPGGQGWQKGTGAGLEATIRFALRADRHVGFFAELDLAAGTTLDIDLPVVPDPIERVRWVVQDNSYGLLYARMRAASPAGHERSLWLTVGPRSSMIAEPWVYSTIEWGVPVSATQLPGGWTALDLDVTRVFAQSYGRQKFRALRLEGLRIRDYVAVARIELYSASRSVEPAWESM